MKFAKQTTLRKRAVLTGNGVHSNAPGHARPASRRSRQRHRLPAHRPPGRRRPAHRGQVVARFGHRPLHRPRRRLARRPSSTVEHLLAALPGLGVDNVLGRDRRAGSADHGRLGGRLRRRHRPGRPRDALRRRAAISRSSSRSASSTAGPSPNCARPSSGFRLDVEIDFPVGRHRPPAQERWTSTPATFRREICARPDLRLAARRRAALEARLRARLLARQFGRGRRRARSSTPRACASPTSSSRHKMLDAVGDLALAGAPIIGTLPAFCPGHR